MSTTSTFKGIDDGAKPSSRVLKSPGGGSSNIFNVPERQAAPPPAKQAPMPEAPAAQPPAKQAPMPEAPAAQPQASQAQPQASQQSAAARGSRGPRNSGFNPITGEPYMPKQAVSQPQEETEQKKEAGQGEAPQPVSGNQPRAGAAKAEQERSSTRVMNPPGGKCSNLWMAS